jgi:hypothetical protein
MKLANNAWYETFEEGPYTTLLDIWATPADHETLPYTINSKGKIYQRSIKEFREARDKTTGKFVTSKIGDTPVRIAS